jgi:hypothetical protein
MFERKHGRRLELCQIAADQLTLLYSEEGNFGLGRPTWLNDCVARRQNNGQVGTTPAQRYEGRSGHQIDVWGVVWREGR